MWLLRCQGRQLQKRRPASADFLPDSRQCLDLFPQCPPTLAQHLPGVALVRVSGYLRFTPLAISARSSSSTAPIAGSTRLATCDALASGSSSGTETLLP